MATPTIRESLSSPAASAGGVASVSVTTTSSQVGDWIIAFHQIGFRAATDLVTPAAVTGTSGWTTIHPTVHTADQPTSSGGSDVKVKAWKTKVTTAGNKTVTFNPGGTDTNTLHVLVVVGADPDDPVDGTPDVSNGTTGNQDVGPITTTTADALLIAGFGAYGGSIDYTGLAVTTAATTNVGTTRTDLKVSSNNAAASYTRALTVSGATATYRAIATTTSTDSWAGIVFAVAEKAIPVAVTDTGAGADTTTVDKTDIKATVTDTGVGVDATPEILADLATITDSADGVDTATVDIVFLVDPVTDTGNATDAIEVADFIGNNLTDSGDAVDVIDVQRLTFIDLADAGSGGEVISDERQWPLTDSGVGQDSLVPLGIVGIVDNSAGTFEEIHIVDIPFTQVLPPSRLGNLYDLVVMARVPQASGPPLLIDVDPIEWTDLSFTNELSVAQELSVGCQLSNLTPGIVQRLRDLATQPTELWLYRNGRLVFAGPIQGGNATGEKVTITAKGILSYLRHMYVTADLVYKDVDQHTIVKGLVDHWQNLTYGNFGINTAAVATSGVTREVTYLKTELHNIAQRVEEMGKAANGFDVEIDPETRNLILWYPQKGIDRSSGEDAVVFDTRNITSSSVMFSAGPSDIATFGLGTGTASTGDGTTYGTAVNDDLMSKFGRAGIAGNWDQVPDQTTLNNHVQGMLDARNEPLVVPGPDARDTPDSNITTYSVGDTILYQPNELLMTTSAYRIRKQTVKVTGSGQESVSLEFV